jgi:CTP:molybdopterin cytidylyltransferase MocA
VQAPPILYARSLFPALLASGSGGGRRVIGDHRQVAAELHWPESVLADLDRPDDVARLGAVPPDPPA